MPGYVIERRLFFRLVWVLPLLAIGLAAMAGSWLWPWVEHVALPPLEWGKAFSWPYLLLPLLTLVFLFAWWLGIDGGRFVPVKVRSWPWGLAAGLVLVGSCELLFRQAVIQQPFLLAVGRRAESPFLRDVWPIKLDVLQQHGRPHVPGIAVVGTSQLNAGVQYERLREACDPVPVRRRSIAGMMPLRMNSVLPALGLGPGDLALLYVSEFDLTFPYGVVASWHRPLATPAGALQLPVLLPAEYLRRDWRQLVDIGMAASLNLWSARDDLRTIALAPLYRTEEYGALQQNPVRRPEEAVTPETVDLNLEALAGSLRWLRGQGVRVVVVQGATRPDYEHAGDAAQRRAIQDRLARLCADEGVRFEPLASQGFAYTVDDWRDSVHLNEAGRDKLTAYLAALLPAAWRNEVQR